MTIQKSVEELSKLVYNELKKSFSPSKSWIWVDHFADEIEGFKHFNGQFIDELKEDITLQESFADEAELDDWVTDATSVIRDKLTRSDFFHSAQQAMHG